MARKGLTEVAPTPLDEEERPLLDAEHPDHGTITREQAIQEERLEEGGPAVQEPGTGKVLLIMGPLFVASFFAALDMTIVATLASPISTTFHSFTLLSWLASGYLIANAAIQPLSGRLSDIYGRKAGIIFACTFFAAGTLICGVAQDAWVIILGRLVAGAGGGCINTVGTFIASDLIPLRKRGLWQGYMNIVFGAGMGLGGVFGGVINDRLNWRWAFYIQVPFIVLAGILAGIFVDIPVKETDKSKIRRVDFAGAITLCASLVLLLLGLNSGGNVVPWKHPLVLVSLPLSGVFLIAFVIIEDRFATEPIIPVRLLLHRTVAACCLTNWFITMSVFSIIYYVPLFFQVVQHLSATAVGLRLIPYAAGASIGSLSAGILMRATGRYYFLNAFSQISLVVASALVAALFNRALAPWPPFLILLVHGSAYGAMLTVTLLALLAAVGHEHQAVITSASYAFRSTGSTIGITISSAVFQNILKADLWSKFGDYKDAERIIGQIRDDVDFAKTLGPKWQKGVVDSYEDALQGVWVVVLGLAVLGAVSSLFMREHVLHSKLDRK